MTAVFHRRWLTRLFFPLCFVVYVAVWASGSAVVTTSTVLIGIASILGTGGLSAAVWWGRLVVEPGVVRLRSLFGWRTAIRFDELARVECTYSRRGRQLMLVGQGSDVISIDDLQYPITKICRAIAPGLDGQAGRGPLDPLHVVDTTGVLRDAMTTEVTR